jgi:hypothetical protein
MTTSTSVEVLAPRRPLDAVGTDGSLPADRSVQVGTVGGPIADSSPPHDSVAAGGKSIHVQRTAIVEQGLILPGGAWMRGPTVDREATGGEGGPRLRPRPTAGEFFGRRNGLARTTS